MGASGSTIVLSACAIGGIVAGVIAVVIIAGVLVFIGLSRSDTLYGIPPKLTNNTLELESLKSG